MTVSATSPPCPSGTWATHFKGYRARCVFSGARAMMSGASSEMDVAATALRYVERRHEARARNRMIDECHASASAVFRPVDIGVDEVAMVTQKPRAAI